MTRALHILSAVPGRDFRQGRPYAPDFFEAACGVLSALMWRKLNGTVKFYLDGEAYAWFDGNGLLDAYDGGVDVKTLEEIPPQIDQRIFWASPKLFALKAEKAPVAMMDLDLVIWKNLDAVLAANPLTVLHTESLRECYLPPEALKTRPGYAFDPAWSWTEALPFNTGFAHFADQAFKDLYVEKAVDFMWDNKERARENVSQMVFAEQRLLSMLARARGIRTGLLVEDPFNPANDVFTHLWGTKQLARQDPGQRARLVRALMVRIRDLDPALYRKLRAVDPDRTPGV